MLLLPLAVFPQIKNAREGNMGNCHPEKTNDDQGEAKVVIGFRGVTISYVTLLCSHQLL